MKAPRSWKAIGLACAAGMVGVSAFAQTPSPAPEPASPPATLQEPAPAPAAPPAPAPASPPAVAPSAVASPPAVAPSAVAPPPAVPPSAVPPPPAVAPTPAPVATPAAAPVAAPEPAPVAVPAPAPAPAPVPAPPPPVAAPTPVPPPPPVASSPAPSGSAAATIAALRAQAERWDQAIVRKDRAAIEANMADDFRQIDGSGNIELRKAFVDGLMAKELEIDPYQVHDFEVRLYGDTALLSGRTHMTGRWQGAPFASAYRYIDVYAKRGNEWKIVSVQITRLPPGDGPQAEEDLRRIEDDRRAAIKRKDWATLERIYAPEFLGVTANGRMIDRDTLLKVFAQTDPTLDFVTDQMEVRTHGNSAVFTGRLLTRAADGRLLSRTRFTHVFVRRGASWVCVSGQSTPEF